MDRELFISCYKKVLLSDFIESNTNGLAIITSYIQEKGTDFHREHISEFIPLLQSTLVYKYCLQWAIDYYVSKYSDVIISLSDPNSTQEHIISIY